MGPAFYEVPETTIRFFFSSVRNKYTCSTFILSKLLLLMFSMFNEVVETNTHKEERKKKKEVLTQIHVTKMLKFEKD